MDVSFKSGFASFISTTTKTQKECRISSPGAEAVIMTYLCDRESQNTPVCRGVRAAGIVSKVCGCYLAVMRRGAR